MDSRPNLEDEMMKNRKKFLALSLALAVVLSLAACGGKKDEAPVIGGADGPTDIQVTDSDMAYVKDKGTLIVGITEFEPMDYQDASGEWIGFDADLAKAFAESLGVTAEFQLIEWDSKVMELEGKTLDVVWNGMTLTDDVKAAMECSNPYFNNAQVVIVKADKAADYRSVDSVKGLNFAVENGSAGQEQVEAIGAKFTPVLDQATALLEVQSGTADAAVIDYLMAAAMTGEGTNYDDLEIVDELAVENYGVAFRKGSDVRDAVNEIFAEMVADGSLKALADQYGLELAD